MINRAGASAAGCREIVLAAVVGAFACVAVCIAGSAVYLLAARACGWWPFV